MKRSFLPAVIALFVSSMVSAGPTLTPEVKDLLAEAKKSVPEVSSAELRTIITDNSAILIDVRDPNEWEKGVINAERLVKISRGLLEIKYPKLILAQHDKTSPYIVYCALGPRSILASKRMQELGFTNVRYLSGGIKAFNAAK